MNRKFLGLIVVVVIGICAAVIALAGGSDMSQTSQKQTPDTPQNQAPAADPTPAQPAVAGKYVAYSADALASDKGTKLIFFHAPWCSQCRSIEKGINEQGVPSGVVVYKADYDSNQALRKKYGVTIQTTIVKVDDQGNLIDKYVAYQEPTFDSVIKNLL